MKWDWATLLLCAVWMREEGAGETFLLKMNYFPEKVSKTALYDLMYHSAVVARCIISFTGVQLQFTAAELLSLASLKTSAQTSPP